MANVFVNLPLPVLNGAGTFVDVSAMGRDKVLLVKGAFDGPTVSIEISNEAGGAGVYVPIASFQAGEHEVPIAIAALYARTHVKNRITGQPFTCDADVSGDDQGALAAALAMPVSDGDGAAQDVSALGTFKTFVVTGGLAGAAVTLEISLDGTAYAPVHTFNGAGGYFNYTGAAFRARTAVVGITPAFTATASVGATGDPAPPVPIPGVPGDSNCLIYRPGGIDTGPVVWNSWPALYAYLDAMRTKADGGCYVIEFDDSLTSPAVVPARVAAWNMAGVDWEGGDNGAAVSLADGATFTDLRSFYNLVITGLSVAPSVAPISDAVDGDQFFLRKTTLLTDSRSTIAFVARTAVGTVTFWLNEGSFLGGTETGPVLKTSGIAVKVTRLVVDSSSGLPAPAALIGDAASTLEIDAPSMLQIPVVATWLTATTSPVLEDPSSLRPNPYLGAPSAVAVTALHGQWLRLVAGGGGITQPLPAINTAAGDARAAGVSLLITNAIGAAGSVTVTAAAGDTVGGAASQVILTGASLWLVSNGVTDWQIVAQPAAAPASAGGDSTCLVFQPGGAAVGPVVFNAWTDLYAQLQTFRVANGGGCYTIEFDDSLTSPAVVPVGAGAWDMTGVSWEGSKNGAAVSLADGSTFTQLRRFFNLTVTSLAAGASPSPVADVADGDQFFLRKTSLVGTSSTKPFVRLDGAGTFRCWMNEGSSLVAAGGGSNGRVFSYFGAGVVHLQVVMDSSSGIPLVAALGQGGAGADLSIEAPDGIQIPVLGGLWTLAATYPIIEGPANLRPNPYLGAASSVAVTLLHGQWARLNAQVGVGALTQALPTINAATGGLKAAGVMVAVSNDHAADSVVTVTPAGGDTIEGLASVTVAPGGLLLLVSNGVSDWTIVSIYPAVPGTYVNVTGVVAQPIAGVPIVIGITLADAAGADYTVTVTGKFEILDAWLIKVGAGAANTTKLVNVDGAPADITDLMPAAVDKTVTRVATLDLTKTPITSGAFRITTTRAAGSAAQTVYVLGVFRP